MTSISYLKLLYNLDKARNLPPGVVKLGEKLENIINFAAVQRTQFICNPAGDLEWRPVI